MPAGENVYNTTAAKHLGRHPVEEMVKEMREIFETNQTTIMQRQKALHYMDEQYKLLLKGKKLY